MYIIYLRHVVCMSLPSLHALAHARLPPLHQPNSSFTLSLSLPPLSDSRSQLRVLRSSYISIPCAREPIILMHPACPFSSTSRALNSHFLSLSFSLFLSHFLILTLFLTQNLRLPPPTAATPSPAWHRVPHRLSDWARPRPPRPLRQRSIPRCEPAQAGGPRVRHHAALNGP